MFTNISSHSLTLNNELFIRFIMGKYHILTVSMPLDKFTNIFMPFQ